MTSTGEKISQITLSLVITVLILLPSTLARYYMQVQLHPDGFLESLKQDNLEFEQFPFLMPPYLSDYLTPPPPPSHRPSLRPSAAHTAVSGAN